MLRSYKLRRAGSRIGLFFYETDYFFINFTKQKKKKTNAELTQKAFSKNFPTEEKPPVKTLQSCLVVSCNFTKQFRNELPFYFCYINLLFNNLFG